MNQITVTMQRAVAAIQQSDFTTAQQLAKQALKLQPTNPQILQVLGIAQMEGGDPVSGMQTLERALALAPKDTGLRFNVAKAAFQARRFDRVEVLLTSVGEDVGALHLRALAQKEAGNHDKAADLFSLAANKAPNDPQLLNNFGNALISAGRFKEAIEVLARALSNDLRSAHILLNLGRARSGNDEFAAALDCFRQAAAIKPQDAQVQFELGKSLLLHSSPEEALPLLSEAARGGIRDPEVFILIGSAYSALELREEAEKAYRMALTLAPSNIRAHVNLGLLFEQENRINDLAELVSQAEVRGITGGDIAYLRALLLQREGNLPEALSLVQSSQPEFLDEIVRDEFIGKIADRIGDYTVAWHAFTRMNAAMANKPEARQFNGSEHSALIASRTIRMSTDWAASWIDHAPSDQRLSPVMLGGFLRSGTTLLDTILMGHPSTHVREEEAMIARLEEAADEIDSLPEMGLEGIAAMRNAYYDELQRGSKFTGDALLIDKYPLMTVRAAFIHRAFPDAKYVFALRHPCDVVLSCYMQNFRVTRAMSSFLTIENSAKLYDAVMCHWMRAREVLPLNVHTVRYEDMVVDLEGELRPLLDFLGLEWDASLLDYQTTAKERGYIRTPSYAQVTEKLYTRSSGRWESYREFMRPILPILAPWVERFGYEPLEL